MLQVYISGIVSCAIRFTSKLFIDSFFPELGANHVDLTCNASFDRRNSKREARKCSYK